MSKLMKEIERLVREELSVQESVGKYSRAGADVARNAIERASEDLKHLAQVLEVYNDGRYNASLIFDALNNALQEAIQPFMVDANRDPDTGAEIPYKKPNYYGGEE